MLACAVVSVLLLYQCAAKNPILRLRKEPQAWDSEIFKTALRIPKVTYSTDGSGNMTGYSTGNGGVLPDAPNSQSIEPGRSCWLKRSVRRSMFRQRPGAARFRSA